MYKEREGGGGGGREDESRGISGFRIEEGDLGFMNVYLSRFYFIFLINKFTAV